MDMSRLFGPFLVTYMTHLINYCIAKSVIPNVWKISIVRPVSKTKSKTKTPASVSHLWPISSIPFLSKVFEKVVLRQLREHLDRSNILPGTHSGFCPVYDCSFVLFHITDDILHSTYILESLRLLQGFDYDKPWGLQLGILNYVSEMASEGKLFWGHFVSLWILEGFNSARISLWPVLRL